MIIIILLFMFLPWIVFSSNKCLIPWKEYPLWRSVELVYVSVFSSKLLTSFSSLILLTSNDPTDALYKLKCIMPSTITLLIFLSTGFGMQWSCQLPIFWAVSIWISVANVVRLFYCFWYKFAVLVPYGIFDIFSCTFLFYLLVSYLVYVQVLVYKNLFVFKVLATLIHSINVHTAM